MFFINDTATTEIYSLSLHDALPIWRGLRALASDRRPGGRRGARLRAHSQGALAAPQRAEGHARDPGRRGLAPRRRADRKSTRLNSSHANISYAVFCLKKNTGTAINS